MNENSEKFEYSCRCGWIDWNHADIGEATNLTRALNPGASDIPGLHPSIKIHLDGSPAFIVRWGFTGRLLPTFVKRDWVIRSGLSPFDLQSVALGMWRIAGHEFEREQGRSWVGPKRESSYSEEDMVSNLIGLYRGLFGYSKADIRSICSVVSKKATDQMLKEWKADKRLNFTDRPILRDCNECRGVDPSFPPQLDKIREVPVGELFVPVRGRFLSPYFTLRALSSSASGPAKPIDFDRFGNARVI